MRYFDINKALSYNKLFTFIVGERGNGKTYGALNYVKQRKIKYDEEFIYLRRYKTELKKVNTLFDPLNMNDEKNFIRESKGKFYINDEYFGFAHPLSTTNIQAGISTPKVQTIIFDEFLMKQGVYRYLNNEVEDYFLHFWNTIDRYRGVRVIFLANAYSSINPYFSYFNINLDEKQVYVDGDIMVYRCNEVEYREAVSKTRSGELLKKTNYGKFAIDNEFKLDNYDFISEKTSDARFQCDLILDGKSCGVWRSPLTQNIFLCNKHGCYGEATRKYALSTNDLKGASIFVKNLKGIPELEYISRMYRYGKVFYEDLEIKNYFEKIFIK